MSSYDLSLRLIQNICSSFSIMGSLFNFFMYLIFKNLRNEATVLTVYLSISCLFTNISYIIKFFPIENNNDLVICQIQGFSLISSQISTQIWATLISYVAYIKTVTNNSIFRMKERIIYILLGYVFPLVLALALFLTNQIGINDINKHWCWIQNNLIIIGLYYILIWILIILSYYFIIKLSIFLRNYLNDNISNKYTSKLKIIPIIQFCFVFLCTIGRILILFDYLPIVEILVYIIVVFQNLQGFFYAIIFCLNPMVKENLNTFCEKYCCLMKEKKEELIIRKSHDSSLISFE